eukprot:scaffold50705_cov36-Phaeocystis_antarctica.AAC.1
MALLWLQWVDGGATRRGGPEPNPHASWCTEHLFSPVLSKPRKERAGHSRAEAGRVELSRFRDKRLESSGGDERAMRDHHVYRFFDLGAYHIIRNMHFKRCNSLGEMIGPVAPPWASVLCRLGVSHVLGPPDKIVRAS